MTTLYEFCRELPKVELHAHLNGSLSVRTLLALKRLHADAGRADDGLDFTFTGPSGDQGALANCFTQLSAAQALTDTVEALRLATELTMQEFSDNGCVYLELRSTPRSTPHMTREQYVDTLLQAIRENKDERITVKYIASIDRRWSAALAAEVAALATERHRRDPDLLVGVELSGDPACGRFADFVPALQAARDAGLKCSVHCGEVDGDGGAEALEMIAFAPERLGHAVFVPRRELLASRIPVEICLTSNIKSQSVGSYEEHHFSDLYEAGHPVVLCTDDAGLFATSPAHEYAVCAETFGLRRAQLARLALAACDHVFAGDDVRRRLRDAVRAFIDDKQL